MKINWKVRLKHKGFWVSLIALLLVLANQVGAVFGLDLTIYNDQVTAITESVLAVLALLGIIIDPTVSGLSDSEQALKYTKPKE